MSESTQMQPMRKRSVGVTIFAIIFICVGLKGLFTENPFKFTDLIDAQINHYIRRGALTRVQTIKLDLNKSTTLSTNSRQEIEIALFQFLDKIKHPDNTAVNLMFFTDSFNYLSNFLFVYAGLLIFRLRKLGQFLALLLSAGNLIALIIALSSVYFLANYLIDLLNQVVILHNQVIALPHPQTISIENIFLSSPIILLLLIGLGINLMITGFVLFFFTRPKVKEQFGL